MRAFILTLSIAGAVISAPALAHGPQIQTTRDTAGRIITRQIVDDSSYATQLTDPTSVFVMPLGKLVGVWRARPDNDLVGWPGFAYGFGYHAATNPEPFPAGSKFILGFTDGLQSWTGSMFSNATPTEAEAYRGPSNSPTALARTSDDPPFQSLMFPGGTGISFASEGVDTHNTVNYRMLGDGSSLTSFLPGGIYLLSMQLSSTAEQSVTNPVLPSDPFYFVLYKNPAPGSLAAAVESLGFAPEMVQYVPEPSASMLVLFGVAGISGPSVFVRRRNRR